VSRIAWHKAPKNACHQEVSATVQAIKQQTRLQRMDMCHFLDLYSLGNIAGQGRSLSDLSTYYSGNGAPGMRGARFNMVSAVCDTAHSLIAANPPVPIIMTSGTDLRTVRVAERKTKVLQSQMNELAMPISREAFHTACKQGTGIVHGFLNEDGLPELEHVNPLELLVDHSDGMYRQPRSIHREKWMHREVLAEMFPSKRSQIEKTSTGSDNDYVSRFFLSGVGDRDEMLTVWESWHRSPGRGKPGRHTITCSSCTLLDEPWNESEFPFAIVRYRNRSFGFFGAGLIESCRENQARVNHLIRRVAKAQDLASNLIVFNPMGENQLDARWLSNEIGMAFDYDPIIGTPTLAKWDGTLVDLQQQIDLEFERVLRVEGLAESQVNGEGAGKGLSSGVAVRAQDDVMSRRLVNPVHLFQQFNVDIAKLIMRLNDQAAERDKNYEARGFSQDGGRTFLRTSRWSELEIPEGQACVNVMPMSVMPTTPAGRWSAVSEWIQAGFIDKTGAMKLLQFPAIDETASLKTAQLDLCLWQMEKLLDGERVLPMERQDLAMCISLGTDVWAKAQTMNPPDEVQEALDEYLLYAQSLMDMATQAAAGPVDPMAAAMGGAPMAAPGEVAGAGLAAAPMAASAVQAA
jgi:hypothetical protein